MCLVTRSSAVPAGMLGDPRHPAPVVSLIQVSNKMRAPLLTVLPADVFPEVTTVSSSFPFSLLASTPLEPPDN
jgi:hypothetical protein